MNAHELLEIAKSGVTLRAELEVCEDGTRPFVVINGDCTEGSLYTHVDNPLTAGIVTEDGREIFAADYGTSDRFRFSDDVERTSWVFMAMDDVELSSTSVTSVEHKALEDAVTFADGAGFIGDLAADVAERAMAQFVAERAISVTYLDG